MHLLLVVNIVVVSVSSLLKLISFALSIILIILFLIYVSNDIVDSNN